MVILLAYSPAGAAAAGGAARCLLLVLPALLAKRATKSMFLAGIARQSSRLGVCQQ